MAKKKTGEEASDLSGHVYFIYEEKYQQKLEPLYRKLIAVGLTPTEHLNTNPKNALQANDAKITKKLMKRTRIVVIYLENESEDEDQEPLSPWCKAQYRVCKSVFKNPVDGENVLFLRSTDLFGDELDSTCQRITKAHRTGKAGFLRYVNCGQYNFLRIHMLLTTVGRTACQYLLHKRLRQFLLQKTTKVFEKRHKIDCPMDLDSCVTEIQTCQKTCEDYETRLTWLTSDSAATEITELLQGGLDKRIQLKKDLEDIESLLTDTNQEFDSQMLKEDIIRLCMQQTEQSKDKSSSGIVNDATNSLKALIPVFEKAIKSSQDGEEVSLPLEITLTYTLLKSNSLLHDFVLKNPKKWDSQGTKATTSKEKDHDASSQRAHQDKESTKSEKELTFKKKAGVEYKGTQDQGSLARERDRRSHTKVQKQQKTQAQANVLLGTQQQGRSAVN